MLEMFTNFIPRPNTWLMGFEIFALVMILPTAVYFTGHTILRPFPKLFNAVHWLFGAYIFWVFVISFATFLTM
jgi:hypothetical protein